MLFDIAADAAELGLFIACAYVLLGAYARRRRPLWTKHLTKRRLVVLGVVTLAVESPEKDMKGPPGFEEKIMNAAFRIGETQLMADDGMGENTAEFKGMTLVIEVADDAEAKRVFTALGQGGNVTVALMKTFWTSSFGMLTDEFGVPWMVNVAAPKA